METEMGVVDESQIRRVHRPFELTYTPAMPGQLRRAFLGWQCRISSKGQVFGGWMFSFRRKRALTKLGWFSPRLVEETDQ